MNIPLLCITVVYVLPTVFWQHPIYPSLPKSTKYLVSRYLDPLKAEPQEMFVGFKHPTHKVFGKLRIYNKPITTIMESRRRVLFVAQMICNFMPSFDGITFFARNFWNDFGSQVPWTYWHFIILFFSVSQGFYHKNWRDLDIECCFLFGLCDWLIVWSVWCVFLWSMGFHHALNDLFWPIPIGFEVPISYACRRIRCV